MEVLLIDDGSTDGTPDICDEYAQKDKRVRVWHKKNGGVSSARNLGIRESKGDWIVFVDADDAVTDAFLSHVPNNANDLECFNWQYSTGESENEDLPDQIIADKDLKTFLSKHLADYIFRTPWAKFFRSDIIKVNNIFFDEHFRIGEDNLFVLDYLTHCKRLNCIESTGYIYTRPPQKKYALSMESVRSYLTQFIVNYKKLNIDAPKLLLLMETYYYKVLGNYSFKTKMRWESIPAVQELQKRCMPYYGKRKRLFIFLHKYVLKYV